MDETKIGVIDLNNIDIKDTLDEEIIDNSKEKIEEEKKYKKTKIKILKNVYSKFKGFDTFGKILIMIVIAIIIAANSCAINNGFYEGVTYEEKMTKIRIALKTLLLDNPGIDFAKELFFSWCSVKRYDLIFKNAIVILATMLGLYALTGKSKFSTIFTLVFWTVIDIINYIVFDLRGTPIALSDIYSITTAMTVTSGMNVEFTKKFFKFIGLFFIVLIMLIITKYRKDNKNKYLNIGKRVAALLFSIIIIISILNIPGFKTDTYWDLELKYREEGLALGILRQTLDINLKEPEGYSKEKALEILSKYEPEIKENEKVNVFVIINESFSDMNKFYDLNLKDNMPFYNSLTENAIKGTAYSSVYGGSTATVEWEFLTGNTAAFIPPNSIPFLVYVRNDKDTIARYAGNQNYDTYAIHSYYEKCYNRANTYSKMGFKYRTFKEQMTDYELIRPDYPSDLSTYQNMIKQYENRDKSKNFFGYILTMQNHIAYNTSPDIYKNKGYIKGNYSFDQYLSLINDSDTALKEFIEYFSKEEEKTILLFFCDHQPKVNFVHKETDEWLISQKVPYMLWANFDIEEKEGEDISINYLSTLIYDYANLDTNEYIEFLKELKNDIPVYTAKGYKDKDGNTYKIDDETSPYYEKIKEYEILQYYFMFDK